VFDALITGIDVGLNRERLDSFHQDLQLLEMLEPAPNPEAENGPGPKLESEPELELEPEPAPQPEAKPEPEPEAEPEPEPESDPEQAQTDAQTTSQRADDSPKLDDDTSGLDSFLDSIGANVRLLCTPFVLPTSVWCFVVRAENRAFVWWSQLSLLEEGPAAEGGDEASGGAPLTGLAFLQQKQREDQREEALKKVGVHWIFVLRLDARAVSIQQRLTSLLAYSRAAIDVCGGPRGRNGGRDADSRTGAGAGAGAGRADWHGMAQRAAPSGSCRGPQDAPCRRQAGSRRRAAPRVGTPATGGEWGAGRRLELRPAEQARWFTLCAGRPRRDATVGFVTGGVEGCCYWLVWAAVQSGLMDPRGCCVWQTKEGQLLAARPAHEQRAGGGAPQAGGLPAATGVGGDHGIVHDQNWLRFPYVSMF
jgi:hypothetical protein